MHTRHSHTTSAYLNTHTSHTQTSTAPCLTIQIENTTPITSPTQTYNILQYSKANHYLSQRPLHNQHSHIPPHSHYNIHKTNMRHIHTYIVSRHLSTRGNNKILRTTPSHISSSEEIVPRLTRRTLAHLSANISPFLNVYLQKVNAKSHPSSLCPLCTHTQHTLFLQRHPHTHHVVTSEFVDRPRRSDNNTHHPKYLGVTLDRTLSYKQYIQNATMKVVTRNNLLKKMVNSRWVTNARTIRTTVLAPCYSTSEFAPPGYRIKPGMLIDNRMPQTYKR